MADDALIGQMVGRWRVERLLGAGGMGRVYEAVQPEIGARVAIKVLRRESLDDPSIVERFFNEARAVNVIRHENIVDVIDLAKLADGSPYIVMEFLEGASLAAIFRRGRPPLGRLAMIVREVLAALAAAHAKGIVHRDLKPDNVFVSPSGRVTVLDFGIAKLVREQGPTSTRTGMLLGTPAYMAPEQARSQPIDARADVYAAGVILYEGATGGLPFVAANLFDLLKLHVEATPAPPSAKNAEIPPGLERVILRALAKDPAQRFASATEMRDALAAAAEGLPLGDLSVRAEAMAATVASGQTTQPSLAHGETVPPKPQPAPPRARNRLVRYALVAGAVALAAIAVAVIATNRRSNEAAVAPAPPPPPAAEEQLVEQPDGSYTFPLDLANFDPIAAYPQIERRMAHFAHVKLFPYNLQLRGLDHAGRVTPASIVRYAFEAPEYRQNEDPYCLLEVEIDRGKTRLIIANFEDRKCNRPAIARPRCSFAQLWQKALAKGLDPNTTATINIQHQYAEGYLVAAGSNFEEIIDDDCGVAKPEPAKPEPAKPEPAKPVPAKPAAAKRADGWYALGRVDPKTFDLAKTYAQVKAKVTAFAGAPVRAYHLQVTHLDRDGHLTGDSQVAFQFSSRDAAEAGRQCLYNADISGGMVSVQIGNYDDGKCDPEPVGDVRCTFAQVMERARQRGVTGEESALVTVMRDTPDHWQVQQSGLVGEVSDDCR